MIRAKASLIFRLRTAPYSCGSGLQRNAVQISGLAVIPTLTPLDLASASTSNQDQVVSNLYDMAGRQIATLSPARGGKLIARDERSESLATRAKAGALKGRTE